MVDLRWETSSTVLSRHSARTALRITPSFRLSRLEVGSSSSRKGASCRNARATPMRCRSPPDKAPPSSPTGVSYPLGRLRIKPSSAAFLQAASDDVTLTKDLLYDTYTLEDTYPYKDTVRSFKWDVIRNCLAYIENMQRDSVQWVVLQNYKNMNREAPLVRNFVRNTYRRVADTLGVERYQSVPLYLPGDTLVPERYGRDGTLACLRGMEGSFDRIFPITLEDEWLVPRRYLKRLDDSTAFNHVVFVDRLDQNITTLERVDKGHWKIRSMNPATTGRHAPPYAQETPLGMYLLQQKKSRMVFLKDGSAATGGYAPYASRFTNGAYIHGVPVNVPRTEMIEYSWSLGTTPRSHMCVRNATSHAKFIFDWAPEERSLVVVIE